MTKSPNNISVIIRTKNSDKTIQSCLDSLFQQSIQVREVIIVDSGSTDNTLNIINQYKCKLIHYPKKELFNYSKALNLGISVTEGQYILNLSSHILMKHTKTIEFMVNFLIENNSICAVSSYAYRKIPYKEEVSKKQDIDWLVYTLNNFKGSAMFNFCALFHKKHWKEYPFNENLPTAEDQEWIHFFMKKHNFGAIVIYNPFLLYLNPYENINKMHQEIVTVGRYIYPPILTFKYIFRLVIFSSFEGLVKLDFHNVYKNYLLAFVLIKEKFGFKMKISSMYNKKLK